MKRLLLAAAVTCLGGAAQAAPPITGKTTCTQVREVYDTQDMVAAHDIYDFVINALTEADQRHIKNGEAGLMVHYSDDTKDRIVAGIFSWCDAHPRANLQGASDTAYENLRAFIR